MPSNLAVRDIETLIHPYTNLDQFRQTGPLVIERGKASVLSSQASYSTWRDFGAAVGPLTAPWLFLNVSQSWLFGALGLLMASGVVVCLARR